MIWRGLPFNSTRELAFPLNFGAYTVALVRLLALTSTALAAGAEPHWAFQKVGRPAIPSGVSADSPVDRFIETRLSEKGLKLSTSAPPATLLRRLSFDLRGIPPSPEELHAFESDARVNAWSLWVERFLASTEYGERWGRHWLDVVGYADSNGYFNADSDRPLAWKYRDYVVRSIAADMPFDRFLQEQIAGDELVGFSQDGDISPETVESLISTHLFRNVPDGSGESDGNPLEVKVDRYSVLEGVIQLTGSAFLGVTLQCARCHDHKFEPVSQGEYYRLQAIFRPAFDPEAWLKPNDRTAGVAARTIQESVRHRIQETDRALATVRESLGASIAPFRRQLIEERVADLPEAVRKPLIQAFGTPEKDRSESMRTLLKAHTNRVEFSDAALAERFPTVRTLQSALETEKTRLEREKPSPLEAISMLAEPARPAPMHHMLVRGNHAQEGAEAPPGFPAAFGGETFEVATRTGRTPNLKTSGRRLAFARWLTSADHPTTARLMVNRVWHHHFGQGIVPTLDNLGRSGGHPSHPELLDWLAADLLEHQSLKRLHRLILNSATWRQSTASDGSTGQADPSNRLLSRYPLRRLDADSVRDAMLAVSGELDPRLGGPYVPVSADNLGQMVVDETNSGARRRSLYLQQRRGLPATFVSTFDGPIFNPVCILRVPSTVAQQSLALLNSEFVRRRARSFGLLLLASSGDEKVWVREAFRRAVGRVPDRAESEMSYDFLASQRPFHAGESPRNAQEQVWTDFCQMLLASNAFLHVD
ncbi:MAG: DUF1553 domain-containing protein [Pedosphaera sp.]|nr:DUF1553 domain-containing protein [Pedosphaera sp.]